MTSTDRIEKQIVLRAARARVWRALTDAGEFGTWFGAKLDGEFAVGQRLTGHVTYPGYEHLRLELDVVRMDEPTAFAYRWHPYAIEPSVDYTTEPTTLVEFTLEDTDGGTRLTVVESGFDALPAGRRDLALRMNTQGWTGQVENVRRHVET